MSLVGKQISVRFGGLQALDDVTVEVEPGSVLGMVGPNGAGKTTLFNCLTGVVTPSSGSVSMDGNDITNLRPDLRVRGGIGRSFQTPRLDLDATITGVVALGFYSNYKQSALGAFLTLPKVRAQEAEIRERSVELMRTVGITRDPHTRARDLSLGELRLLEVARALATGAKYLLLDECAAGVDGEDRERLSITIREVAKGGVGVLLVEHDFAWLRTTSDELTVLVEGKLLARGAPDVIARDDRVISAYLGEASDV